MPGSLTPGCKPGPTLSLHPFATASPVSVEQGSSSLLRIAPTLVLMDLVPTKSSRQRFPRYPTASFSPHPAAPVRQRPDIRACSHAFALSARRDSKARGLISRMLHRTTDCPASGGTGTWPHHDASSGDALTRLSYTGTQRSCLRWCRCVQASPPHPAVFPRPHQPTCVVQVIPFRAPLGRDSHPFAIDRVAHIAVVPVSAPPNLHGSWIGSKETLQSPAPVASGRAPLRASGYSDTMGWLPMDFVGICICEWRDVGAPHIAEAHPTLTLRRTRTEHGWRMEVR